jgi:membrane-associated protease RseP (regulator of RpoE activity)
LDGLQAGQVIETVGGWNMTEAQINSYIQQAKPGSRLLLGVRVPGRGADQLATDIVTVGRGPDGHGSLGLQLAPVGPTSHPIIGAAATALSRTSANVAAQVSGASRLVSSQGVRAYGAMLTGHHITASDQQLRATSLIGLVRLSAQASRASWYDALLLLAAINLALALFNALPVPPLDGGHTMLVLYQRVWGRPVPVKVVHWTTIAVLTVFASFAMISGLLDIIHPAANPFH